MIGVYNLTNIIYNLLKIISIIQIKTIVGLEFKFQRTIVKIYFIIFSRL